MHPLYAACLPKQSSCIEKEARWSKSSGSRCRRRRCPAQSCPAPPHNPSVGAPAAGCPDAPACCSYSPGVSSYKAAKQQQRAQHQQLQHSLRELQLGQFINSCHIAKIDCNDLYFLLPFTLYFAPNRVRVHFLILSPEPFAPRLLLLALCPRFHLVNTFTIISFHCFACFHCKCLALFVVAAAVLYAFVSFRLVSFLSFASLVSLSLSELDWLQRLPGAGRREGSANLLWSTQYNVLRL